MEERLLEAQPQLRQQEETQSVEVPAPLNRVSPSASRAQSQEGEQSPRERQQPCQWEQCRERRLNRELFQDSSRESSPPTIPQPSMLELQAQDQQQEEQDQQQEEQEQELGQVQQPPILHEWVRRRRLWRTRTSFHRLRQREAHILQQLAEHRRELRDMQRVRSQLMRRIQWDSLDLQRM